MTASGRRPGPRAAHPRERTGDAPIGSAAHINPVDHLKWSRSIARGVRDDAKFLPGSHEESELEAEAYLVVVEYAQRFDPLLSFRVGAERVMLRAATSHRRGSRRPTGPRVYTARLTVVGIDVSEWVRERCQQLVEDKPRNEAPIAREWAARAAHQFAQQFDVSGAFRGWCVVEVRTRCRREAYRLRNGGTYHTARPDVVRLVRIEEVSAPKGESESPRPRCPNCLDYLAAHAPGIFDADEDRDALSLESHTIYDTTPE